MIKIVLIGISASILILIVKEWQRGIAAMILMAGSLSVILLCVDYLESIIAFAQSIQSVMQIDRIYIKILLKIVGIAYICQFSGDICQDLGSQALGRQIESAGKLAVLVIGIPIIQALLDTIKELLSL